MSVLVCVVRAVEQSDQPLASALLETLRRTPFGAHVHVDELAPDLGAVTRAVATGRATVLVLVGSASREGSPGEIRRTRVRPLLVERDEPGADVTVGEGSRLAFDEMVEAARGRRALPGRTVAFEIEPGCVDWAMWWGLLEELERLGAPGTGGSATAPAPLR